MSSSPWKERLEEITRDGLSRRMRVLDSGHGPLVDTIDGPKLLFCSNDYLGLSNHPDIIEALATGAHRWGFGSGGSRLISGNTTAHEVFERHFALFAGTDEAVLFPSGFQANVGSIPALAREGDVIFSDALTHASIVDGTRLSRARVRVFRHRDLSHLASLLTEEPATGGIRLIITDAVFSMDGDVAPIRDLAELARSAGALLYIDEAHSAGVMGPQGRGLAWEGSIADVTAIRVFPLGKAFGASGACVVCDSHAAGIIRSGARSLLYTTGAPAALSEALTTGLDLVMAADPARARIEANIRLFKELANEAGLPLIPSDTAIQPVLTSDSARTMKISEVLWDRGIFVQGIRPPTVEEGSCRLRVTLCAFHEDHHVSRLVEVLRDAMEATR